MGFRGRRRRVANVQMSPDRQYWWDGSTWRPAATEVPPTAFRSADGNYWWDGVSWRPVPTQSQGPPQGP
jgi:hypothetical protein